MRTVPLSDIADRGHGAAGHEAADAGVVPRHASESGARRGCAAWVGRQAFRFDECGLAGSAQTDAGDDRTRRRYKLGADGPRIEIMTPISAASAPERAAGRRTQNAVSFAVETSKDGERLYARLQVVRGFRPAKRNGYARVWRPEHGDQRRRAMVSLHCLAAGSHRRAPRDGCGRTAAGHGAFRWANTVLANVKNSLLATHRAVAAKHLRRYLGAFAWRFNSRFV